MIASCRIFAASILAMALLGLPAHAMEGMDMSGSNNTCPVMAGGMHELHLSAYHADTAEELCMDVPKIGQVTISIDAVSAELRDMTTEIRVVNAADPDLVANGNLDPITVTHLPPRRYPTGTATFPVNFTSAGKYAVLLTFRDDTGMVMTASHPLTVGAIFAPWMIVGAVFGVALVVGLGMYYRAETRKAKAAAAAKSS